jgi:uncharacterized protein YhaN
MRISRVDIQGFGTFSSARSFRFGENALNVVYGGNESGKSTLVSAIYATLFGFEKKETEQGFKSWSPSEAFTGTVELEVRGGTVSFSRDFSTNQVVVTRREGEEKTELFRGEASPRSRSEEKRAYSGLLRELLGFSDGNLAKKTSFVGQLDIETEFTPALRGLISGAGTADYHGAMELLKEKFGELTTVNPWGADRRKKRAMEETADALAEKRRQLGEAELLFRESSRIASENSELRKEMSQLEKQHAERSGFLKKINRLVELQNKVKGNQGRYESERRARDNLERAEATCKAEGERLFREHPLFVRLSEGVRSSLSSEVERGAAVEGKLEQVEAELAREQKVLSEAPRSVPYWLIAAVSMVIFAALFVVGALQGRIGTLSAVGAAISAVYAVVLWLMSRRRRRSRSRAEETVATVGRKQANLTDELDSVSEKVRLLLPEEHRSAVEGQSLRELYARLARFTDDSARVDRLKAELLSEGGPDAQKAHETALKELAVAQSQLEEFLKEEEGFLSLKDRPEEAARMGAGAERDAEGLDSRLKELDSKVRESEREQARLSAMTLGPPEAYQEETARLERKLSRLTQRRDALALAVNTLAQCVDEYQAESMERISGRISELFGLVTGARYAAVKLSESEKPTLETSSGRRIGLEPVSTGTRDQLYFCMRIAMLEELSGDKNLPLILDDPFVNFDDERLEKARGLLCDLVSGHKMQIIVFTHGERHLEWGGHVVRLATT